MERLRLVSDLRTIAPKALVGLNLLSDEARSTDEDEELAPEDESESDSDSGSEDEDEAASRMGELLAALGLGNDNVALESEDPF